MKVLGFTLKRHEDAQEGDKKDAFEGSFEGTPKGVLRDLYKDAQEGVFEAEIKGALEVAIELHLMMLMVVHFLGHKSAPYNSIKR